MRRVCEELREYEVSIRGRGSGKRDRPADENNEGTVQLGGEWSGDVLQECLEVGQEIEGCVDVVRKMGVAVVEVQLCWIGVDGSERHGEE